MSRKIKFKAWDKFRNRIINNVLTIKLNRINGKPRLIVYTDKKINPHREIKEIDRIYCNEFELLEYTGLKDKNGKEIYEGDLLKITEVNNKGIKEYVTDVVWEEGAFFVKSGGSDYDTFLAAWFGNPNEAYPLFELEVIGNIYENPELLEGENK